MEVAEKTAKKGKGWFPLVALACALAALLMLVAAGFGTRIGLWQFRTGFAILGWGGYLGIASALLAILTLVLCARWRRWLGLVLSLLALVCGILAFGLPYSWKMKAVDYPRIHDITTDPDNPPQFVALAPMRDGRVAYGGTAIAVMQLKAYPDIKTVVVNEPAQQVFRNALETARAMGWQIVAEVPQEGRIEASDTTFWFGFTDDIAIRVTPAAQRSLLDIRSASRVGISDVGTNAARIRAFLKNMSHR